ncbi:hypothetical protein RFI_30490 [Reticulomyxa filosa]|uniref:Uncharacterized protein n=1 Tax=Reticulomyxa filosa TaxID=46433 RepID=X6M0I4_RETFI|nr:hypothetical protein RFI_30490 [Reticulomyxa filosa]|eukprot:ETO06902.1 hypothetical protein RFI_30490 [Reticulomyxa filosa]
MDKSEYVRQGYSQDLSTMQEELQHAQQTNQRLQEENGLLKEEILKVCLSSFLCASNDEVKRWSSLVHTANLEIQKLEEDIRCFRNDAEAQIGDYQAELAKLKDQNTDLRNSYRELQKLYLSTKDQLQVYLFFFLSYVYINKCDHNNNNNDDDENVKETTSRKRTKRRKEPTNEKRKEKEWKY